MNHTNCAPGGKATQASRSAEAKVAIGRMGGLARAACTCGKCTPARLSAIGRRGGTISQARKTAKEKSASGRHAAKARWHGQ